MDAYYCGIIYVLRNILYGVDKVIRGYAYRGVVVLCVVGLYGEDLCNTQPTPTHIVHLLHYLLLILLLCYCFPPYIPTIPTHIHTRLGAFPRYLLLFSLHFSVSMYIF